MAVHPRYACSRLKKGKENFWSAPGESIFKSMDSSFLLYSWRVNEIHPTCLSTVFKEQHISVCCTRKQETVQHVILHVWTSASLVFQALKVIEFITLIAIVVAGLQLYAFIMYVSLKGTQA